MESTWLKLLPLELASIDPKDFIDPSFEMEKDDRVIGEMSDFAKRLYTLGWTLKEAASRAAIDARFGRDQTVKAEAEARASELLAKAELLRDLMWICIHEELGSWTESIGIRYGYKIVTYPEKPQIFPFNFGAPGGGQ